ncbi:MAG: cell division protein FtsX [Paenibacillaceae bacterium ZCTH02-B3]|nr:MAG: cell division protein FtsX [Paenibacillaceae bacterium ZCTH02-B3]
MRFSTFSRHIREGTKSIIRNGWMSFASISSIAVSLFILGVFMLLTLNVNRFADQVESQAQIRVFLELDTPEEKIAGIERQIKLIPEVKSVVFVSKHDALERLRETLGENADVLDGYEAENNPLPDGFDVDVFEPRQISIAAEKIKALNDTDPDRSIMRVRYGEETVKQLFRITNGIRNIGLVIVLGLAVTAMFLISTSIRMTIYARRREIAIMKLVGATNGFIRWPFFVEGALTGLIGSLITAAGLLAGYAQVIRSTRLDLGLMMFDLVPLEEAFWPVGGTIVGLGTLIGIFGSILSVRKYLRV